MDGIGGRIPAGEAGGGAAAAAAVAVAPHAEVVRRLVEAGPALSLTPHDRSSAVTYSKAHFEPSLLDFDRARDYGTDEVAMLLETHHDLTPTAFQRFGDEVFIHTDRVDHPIRTTVAVLNEAIARLQGAGSDALAGNFAVSLLVFDTLERVKVSPEATSAILNRFRGGLAAGENLKDLLSACQLQVVCATAAEDYMTSRQGFARDTARIDNAPDEAKAMALREKAGLVEASFAAARGNGDYETVFNAIQQFGFELHVIDVSDPEKPRPKLIPSAMPMEAEVDVRAYTTPEALAQSMRFQDDHVIPNPIPDGFLLTGIGAILRDGGHCLFPGSAEGDVQEIVVVDRKRDRGLLKHIIKAEQIRLEVDGGPGTAEEKQRTLCLKLMQYLDDNMGRDVPSRKWERGRTQKPTYLGDVPHRAGSCRHRALLFSLMAERVGLEVSTRVGYLQAGGPPFAHAWNEVRIGTDTFVADPMNFPDRLFKVGDEAPARMYQDYMFTAAGVDFLPAYHMTL